MSDRKKSRCIYGCPELNAYTHRFPNPKKKESLFNEWLEIVGPILPRPIMEPMRIYKNKRVCDLHFRAEDKVTGHRLISGAVPRLHLNRNGVLKTLGLLVQLEHNYCFKELPPKDVALSHLNVDTSLKQPSTSTTSETYTDPVVVSRLSVETIGQQPSTSTSKTHTDSGTGKLSTQTILKKLKKMEKDNRRLKKKLKKSCKTLKNFKARIANAEKVFLTKTNITKNMTLPARIFTGMQYKHSQKKARGRRFTLEEKVLSLSLYKRSPKCYTTLANLFTLPSSRSLRNLLKQIKLTPGGNKLIFAKIKDTVLGLNTEDRLCTLMFDEMSLSPAVHFNEPADELKGFVSVPNDNGQMQIANHALVFMIKGIKASFKQPVAYFFTQNLKTINLKNILIDIIRKIHGTGLKVICTVCDQGSANSGAIKSLIEDTRAAYCRKGEEFRTDLFEVDNQKIIPLFDVPHLLKGIRNNLLTKDLMYTDFSDGNQTKIIKWEYFQMLYEADKSYKELKFLPKLTEEHVNPEKIKKMKVKMAAQVFSRSVAMAATHMVSLGAIPKVCSNLVPFVLIIDKLFDSLNAGTFHIVNGKEFRAGIKRNSPHHALWQDSLRMLKTVKFLQQKKDGNKIRIIETVAPSVTNLIKTIENMQALWVVLNQKYFLDTMLTRNLNQDPIENFFGNIRSLGVRNTSPDCRAFESAFKTLLINNYTSPQSKNSNCEQDFNQCLQNFDFFLKDKENTEEVVPDGNVNVEISERLHETLSSINIIDDVSKHQQRRYVCGWVLKKCLEKIVKTCKSCRSTITCDQNSVGNEFIRFKEFQQNKQWLCYPSEQLSQCFNEIQDITSTYLKSTSCAFRNKENIKILVNSFVIFPFDCDIHKENLKSYFINLTINILIFSWCRSINRILSGKINYNDGMDDPIKFCAQTYYNKHKNRKY